MGQDTSYPEFHRIESALRSGGDFGDPCELHGALCAMFAVTGITEEAWVRQVTGQESAPGDVPGREAERLLEELYAATAAQLRDAEMGFYPLLPDDDEDIVFRTQSLANWCTGFLFGLGIAGVSVKNFGDEETAEFVRDLGDIARVSAGSDDSERSDEEAYAEIVEYVRMGTILVATQFEGPEPETSLH